MVNGINTFLLQPNLLYTSPAFSHAVTPETADQFFNLQPPDGVAFQEAFAQLLNGSAHASPQNETSLLNRAKKRRAILKWLNLKDPKKEIHVSHEQLQKHMEKSLMRATVQSLSRIYMELEKRKSPPHLAEQLTELLKLFGWVSKTLGKFAIPGKPHPISEEQIKPLIDFVEKLGADKIFNDTDTAYFLFYLRVAFQICRDYPGIQGDGELIYTVALWSRDPAQDQIQVADPIYDDPGSKVLLIKTPNGDTVAALLVRLFITPKGEKLELLGQWINPKNPNQRHWFPQDVFYTVIDELLNGWAKRLRTTIGTTCYLDHLDWRSRLIPVAAPWQAEENHSAAIFYWPHPYAGVLDFPLVSRELMRRADGATLELLNPWLWRELPIPSMHSWDSTTWQRQNLRISSFSSPEHYDFILRQVRDFLLREIEPDSEVNRDDISRGEYHLALSINTGRSVDYPILYQTTDGTRWHHLNAIGVGKTLKARSGMELRDGLLPLEGAQKRFYLTLLMHHTARKYGFRTSLGVAVVNRNKKRKDGEKRPGLSQIEATLYELRREQLRLTDLENVRSLRETIDTVKEKIAKELGVVHLTDKEYLVWFAKTIGEQLAIMTYFGFDHGIFEETPQLGPWNVSLGGEIFDFDASKLSSPEKVFPRYEDENQISVQAIYDLQQNWIHGLNNVSWLAILLSLAPDVDFYRTMMKGLSDKWNELEDKKIDARAAIRRFNTEMWNPWFKKLNRNPQEIYHGIASPALAGSQ